jgi:crossover junction endodeoxyribonuclease RuvC
MLILGIDPGSRVIGYGLVEFKNGVYRCDGYGVITPQAKTAARFVSLKEEIDQIIRSTKPDKMAIERLFFYKNAKTALAVAECRGIILLSAAEHGLDVEEFTPLQLKQSVAHYGRANKSGIQKMVKLILHLQEEPQPNDAADALALAICGAHVHPRH